VGDLCEFHGAGLRCSFLGNPAPSGGFLPPHFAPLLSHGVCAVAILALARQGPERLCCQQIVSVMSRPFRWSARSICMRSIVLVACRVSFAGLWLPSRVTQGVPRFRGDVPDGRSITGNMTPFLQATTGSARSASYHRGHCAVVPR
jgi:hypothetical protein